MEEREFQEMLDRCREHFFEAAYAGKNAKECARIKAAYEFAERAHAGQKRKSGHPYIIHPISVATVVAEELSLGTNPIIAALLHDVAEDTQYSIDDIKKHFGADVAFLVNAVTKQAKTDYDMTKQLDNFRQMLESINYDVRPLLIKLADRLHNMRTLESMPPDKQMKIAGETDYFYAPLANRLGLYQVKSELENLSLKFRTPLEYGELQNRIRLYERECGPFVEEFIDICNRRLSAMGIKATVVCTTRSVYAVWRKMQLSGKPFRQIEAILVINVVFENQPERGIEKTQCLEIYSLLTDVFKEKPGSLVNYIDTPKENGYQALHFKAMSGNGQWIEVHIGSERMARNSVLGCIAEGQGTEHWVDNFKSVLRDIASSGKEDDAYIDNVVCNFYNDDITVFTPQGETMILPKGATALDFAYGIHTRIGHEAVYARINGQVVPVETTLSRGDRVEIGTDPKMTPSRARLDVVKTYRARKAIQTWLRKYNVEEDDFNYQLCERCHPLPGDEVIGFKMGRGKPIMVHKRNCPDAISASAKFGESIVSVKLRSSENRMYPVKLNIICVNRDKLLYDLVKVMSIDLDLTLLNVNVKIEFSIARFEMELLIHSMNELLAVTEYISSIEGVEDVRYSQT